MSIIENARKLRPIVEQAVQAIDGNEALVALQLYPVWAEGTAYSQDYKVQRAGKLYRCRQAHTAVAGWEPETAPALWEQINETHTGEQDDPIPYEGNMALTAGLHYHQDGVIYRCTRDTVNPVHSALVDLVGLYVERA